MTMAGQEQDLSVSLEEKAKRTRDLLTSFYGGNNNNNNQDVHDSDSPSNMISPSDNLKAIDTPSFNVSHYMNSLVSSAKVESLLQRHVQMAAEIKNLDCDLQMLVYENYNKFISATDTIRRMKDNVVGMESNMEKLLDKITFVQSKSDTVNSSLCERREHIEKLVRTRTLLQKVQFIYDLPSRLRDWIKTETYAEAVKCYVEALPLLKAYGETAFESCRKECDESIGIIIKRLQARLFTDTEPVEARAEAVVLLKELNFPVDNLKTKVLETKLEHFISEIQAEARQTVSNITDSEKSSKEVIDTKDSIEEFAKMVTAYRIIFPNSERRLTEVAIDLLDKHFAYMQQKGRGNSSASELISALRVISVDVEKMHEVLPDAGLRGYANKAAENAIKEHVSCTFGHLQCCITGILEGIHMQKKGKGNEEKTNLLHVAFEDGKNALLQGCLEAMMGFRQLLDEDLDVLLNVRSALVDWVQGGIQDFFKNLANMFSLAPQNTVPHDGKVQEMLHMAKASSGGVLVLSQLSLYIEHIAIPSITEVIASTFTCGSSRSYEDGPAFIPAEMCRIFHSVGDKLLKKYITMQTGKLALVVKKSIETPNWVKYKEPRDVRMFADLLLQELKAIAVEVEQVLNRSSNRKHRRTDSTGSTTSSWSNQRDDRSRKLRTHRTESHLLVNNVAKLFKQKVEIFTKLEHTQESVLSTIVKLCLKSFQEYVRLETFSRSGFQQIQLDIQFLREPIKQVVEDEIVIDFLLDEVCAAAAERCLDPIPLEPAILDKLINAKLSRTAKE